MYLLCDSSPQGTQDWFFSELVTVFELQSPRDTGPPLLACDVAVVHDELIHYTHGILQAAKLGRGAFTLDAEMRDEVEGRSLAINQSSHSRVASFSSWAGQLHYQRQASCPRLRASP